MATVNLEPSTLTHIRPMRLEDLEQVLAIDRASFSMPWSERSFRYELLENPYSLLLVAELATPESEHRVVAAIVIWLIEDEAHIATLAVRPDYRGRGISRELLTAGLVESIRRGARLATLEVRASNTIAQALYLRFQFNIAGRRPHYYQDNQEDALIMTAENLDDQYLSWLEAGAHTDSGLPSHPPEVPS
jgi:ribosomal-protein-alanine N-acetyltransferase